MLFLFDFLLPLVGVIIECVVVVHVHVRDLVENDAEPAFKKKLRSK